MKTEDYKKYKDQKPEDTIYRIQSILHEMGLTTVCEWVKNEYDGCYSNRVSIYPTALGTNGKGTDRLYAMASGYAELMERIQNSLLYIGTFAPRDKSYGGFTYYPDEKLLSLDEIIAQKDAFTEYFFRQLGCVRDMEKKAALKRFLKSVRNSWEPSGDEVSCIPYADPDGKRVVYLPMDVVRNIYGSNGMAAGNTREEALVQGLAEVFERYANRRIALEHICPPSIPREVLAKIPSLYRIICEIEKDSAYRVDIKDCSLGRRLPVAAIIIFNQNRGTFGVRFASHPSFSVALERTLTEAFQGKNLETFTDFNAIGSDAQIRHRDNVLNFMKVGNGYYPKEFLADHPDYAFDPDLLLAQRDNAQMLKHMLELVRREGFHPLIHDASYMGFHSYYILVPGMSEMYAIDWMRCRETMTQMRVGESFGHLHAITDEEADRMIRYMTYKESSVLENQLSWIYQHPITDKMPGAPLAANVMKAMLLYQRGRFAQAAEEMSAVSGYFERQQKEDAIFYKCCSYYMFLRANGSDADESGVLIGRMFPEKTARQVSGILADEKKAIRRMYPEPKCFDCEHCEMGETKCCEYRETAAVFRTIKDAMKKHLPDQTELLKLLEEKNVC